MKCPKCGSENPEDAIFCEKCDWQLSRKYRGGTGIDPSKKVTILMYVAIVFGLAALIVSILKQGWFGVAFGAIGMVSSGYAMTVVRVLEYEPKTKKMILGATVVALVASVIGFILGFVYAVA